MNDILSVYDDVVSGCDSQDERIAAIEESSRLQFGDCDYGDSE